MRGSWVQQLLGTISTALDEGYRLDGLGFRVVGAITLLVDLRLDEGRLSRYMRVTAKAR